MNSKLSLPSSKSAPSVKAIKAEFARRRLIEFIKYTMPSYEANWHHVVLCEHLERVLSGDIKKLMVFMPPQHGKSQIVSRHGPAYFLGRNPSLKIVGASYASGLAKKFNRDIQNVMASDAFREVFPFCKIGGKHDSGEKTLKNSLEFEVRNWGGYYRGVGVGGSLTGVPADIAFIDDPVKDAVEAQSLTDQVRKYEWYTDVLLTRLHNDSRIVLTMTRWHENDLAGMILRKEADWTVLSLEAIKDRTIHPKDPRNLREALWPTRHSLEKLLTHKHMNERTFNALYQQDPQPIKEGLVYPNWSLVNPDQFRGSESVFGLDFGYSDYCALVEIKVNKTNLFVREWIYEKRLTLRDLLDRLRQLKISQDVYICCDSARPDIVEELYQAGYNVHGAKKGPGSVVANIDRINKYRLHVVAPSQNIQMELKSYRRKEYRTGEFLDQPIDDHNHAMDAMAYAVQLYEREYRF